MDKYSIRIIVLDSYMTSPTQGLDVMYSEFRGSAINQVPIIRLFGSTETGKKICLHIHGVFPYLYIPYDGVGDVNSLMYQIAINIDKAVNISLNQTSSNTQHVYKITLVSGIPMYGYHNRKHQFFKIHLYNPLLIRRVSDLLMNDTTLGKLYQPHETHLPFALQFMIDYNLHGMSNLSLSEMKFRTDPNEINPSISPDLILPGVVKKLSVCEIEGDAFAEHILNRLEVASGNIGVNPGIAALWADEMQRRRNKGETSQIEHLLELKNTNVEPTKSHVVFKQALLERLAIASTEKDVIDQNLSLSVYPIETPENLNIKNASLIDSQTPSDLELSLNETLISPDINDTSVSEELSMTMDEEAQALLKILQNLEANAKESIEEDSILSQFVKENDEDKDLDLSMPLESVTTPRKIDPVKEDSDDDDDLLNSTLVPQLDGECDVKNENYHEQFVIDNACNRIVTRSCTKMLNDISNRNNIKKEKDLIKKALYIRLVRTPVRTDPVVKKGRDMPLLFHDFDSKADVPFIRNNNLNKLMYTNEWKTIDTFNHFVEDSKSKFVNIPNNTIIKAEDGNECKTIDSFNYCGEDNKSKVENIRNNNLYKLENANKSKAIDSFKHKEEGKSEVKNIPLKTRRKIKRKYIPRPITIKKTMAQLKSWRFQVRRTKRRFQLLKAMRKIRNKERRICIMVSKNCKPIFNVIPGNNYRKQSTIKSNENTEIDIISEIMLQTKNHIDPNLHFTLRYPSEETFLYIYNGNMYPEVNEIPKKFTKPGNEESLKKFITRKTDENNHFKQIKEIEEINNNIEFLKNNNTTFSTGFYNVLQDNYNNCEKANICTKNHTPRNCQDIKSVNLTAQDKPFKRMHFSQEIIDADNEKHHYIFSYKYLTNVSNEILVNKITSQSMSQINKTIKFIKKELEKHIANLKKPICDTKNITTKTEPICDDIKEESEISQGNDKPKNTKKHKPKHIRKDSNGNKTFLDCERSTVKNTHNSLCINYGIDGTFNPKLKRCVFLDGTVDSSSSSEDETSTVKRKRTLKKESVSNSRYSALPITFSSSQGPKIHHLPDKHPVSQNTIKNSKKVETSLNISKSQQTVRDNAKRRLNFSNTLQTTIIQEKLVCSYSPFKKEETVNFNDDKSIIPFSEWMDDDVNIKNTPSHSENSNSSDSKSVNNECISPSSHREIFSNSDSEDEADKSFFQSPQIAHKLNLLTTAEKYDKAANYSAKEGTSKVLTPQSNSSTQKSSEDIHQSSGSSSFGVLTPYQHVTEESSQINKILDDENPSQTAAGDSSKKLFCKNEELPHTNSSISVININKPNIPSNVITPLKKAPTRGQISKSLDEHKIPFIKENIPYYSNIDDVTGSVEVGYNVLKIISKTSAHMTEFESQTDSINNFRKLHMQNMSSNLEWKKSNINNLALSFCKDRHCIIEPIKKPPSLKTVKNWIRERSKKTLTPEKKPEKIKIFLPLSPGNNDEDDELNISLTLSPCTPINSQSSSSQTVTTNQTPKSSKPSQESKRQLSQSFTLRKSLLVSQDKSSSNNTCQITGVSPNNTYGFNRSTGNLQAARAVIEHQHLTLLVMELHIRTRGDFKPNPEYDSIRAIFYSILNDVPANDPKPPRCKGVIAINSLPFSPNDSKVPLLDGAGVNCNITYVDSEENLLNEFLKLVKYWNPDIFAGYEIQMLSWGYLIDRASVLGINLKSLLSRTKEEKKYRDDGGQSELQITGRIVLDVWRLLRHEIALQSYTFESIIYHILHKRVPQYPFKDLSFWWDHRSTLYRSRTVHYYLFRVEMILELFDKLDLIGRTSELARLFGIQFFEVLSRGSQFRVESMMLRLAKPLNFVPVSPSVQQRAFMKAPEYIPLVLEPESKLYNDPVIVLDFQSLYPSIIIAYNYCFTTCLGRVECLGKNVPFQFGASQLKVSKKLLRKLLERDLVNFSPCGVGFVKKEVRDGILPRMLREILDTRLMVKNSMKENKGDQLLQKVLHNRQLGLKLIANVTYGYTAANFSGRMPSVEVGDSVVSKGRETLQRAIEMVDGTPEWGARVVYGDTDSLFVLVPGKTKEHAFDVGKKIADAVTKANPDPIKLKLEKVYQPCILQTKKRYVGYMYESPDQKDPVYDAKGIETVRRDGCPAVSKMLEKCLRLLFETKDISLVKKYVLRQFNKIVAGRASIQDLTFAKEYRGASGYRPGACVPSLELARKWTAVDKRNEPRRGERVPYIIVNGPPGLPLIRLVRSPRDLLNDPSLRPNVLYYITKVIIPPINRCFNLIGADLNVWFNQMPRKQMQSIASSVSPGKKSTISQYFSTTSCVACGEQTQTGICNTCLSKPQITTITLTEKLRNWERNSYNCNLICQTCTGTQTDIKCVSLDCPVLYRRIQTNRDAQQVPCVRELTCSSELLF